MPIKNHQRKQNKKKKYENRHIKILMKISHFFYSFKTSPSPPHVSDSPVATNNNVFILVYSFPLKTYIEHHHVKHTQTTRGCCLGRLDRMTTKGQK